MQRKLATVVWGLYMLRMACFWISVVSWGGWTGIWDDRLWATDMKRSGYGVSFNDAYFDFFISVF